MLRKILSTGLMATAGVALLSGVHTLPASAAEPAQQACVGETVSALAGPGFGPLVASFAQGTGPSDPEPGLGAGIQRLEAGLFPDSFVPNTCNDG